VSQREAASRRLGTKRMTLPRVPFNATVMIEPTLIRDE